MFKMGINCKLNRLEKDGENSQANQEERTQETLIQEGKGEE